MADDERVGADDSGPDITEPGKGVKDEGQAFDGGRQSRELREFRGEEPKP